MVIARKVYVCSGCSDVASANVVQVYDLDKATWTKLPPAPQYHSEAVVVNNQLVLIGGVKQSSKTITNMVSMWTGQGWRQDIPAMPTRRLRPGVTMYNTYIIVAGGKGEDGAFLSSIDVMDVATWQWYTPANLQLPRPMYRMKITVSATHICVASGVIANDAITSIGTLSTRVWQRPKSTLSTRVWQLPKSTLTKVLAGEDHSSHQWTEIAPTPHVNSALVQHTAHPLAVGGEVRFKSTATIAVYNSHSNKWSKVGQLLEPRSLCTVVSLSRHSFLVCGGFSDIRDMKTRLKSAEVVSVQ